jgi:hypothetical protein
MHLYLTVIHLPILYLNTYLPCLPPYKVMKTGSLIERARKCHDIIFSPRPSTQNTQAVIVADSTPVDDSTPDITSEATDSIAVASTSSTETDSALTKTPVSVSITKALPQVMERGEGEKGKQEQQEQEPPSASAPPTDSLLTELTTKYWNAGKPIEGE